MTEQQYRVIADRDKGDDPKWSDISIGDRYMVLMTDSPPDPIVRIERPVPTTDCERCEGHGGLLDAEGNDRDCARCAGSGKEPPSVPTRKQIAEALRDADYEFPKWERGEIATHANYADLADAVLALIQKGTDR